MPKEVVVLRYFLSWTLRAIGLAAGIGMLCLKSIFRKIAILFSLFNIITVTLRHPFIAFERITIRACETNPHIIKNCEAVAHGLAIAAAAVVCIADVLLFAFVIYYLTRPGVRGQFKS